MPASTNFDVELFCLQVASQLWGASTIRQLLSQDVGGKSLYWRSPLIKRDPAHEQGARTLPSQQGKDNGVRREKNRERPGDDQEDYYHLVFLDATLKRVPVQSNASSATTTGAIPNETCESIWALRLGCLWEKLVHPRNEEVKRPSVPQNSECLGVGGYYVKGRPLLKSSQIQQHAEQLAIDMLATQERPLARSMTGALLSISPPDSHHHHYHHHDDQRPTYMVRKNDLHQLPLYYPDLQTTASWTLFQDEDDYNYGQSSAGRLVPWDADQWELFMLNLTPEQVSSEIAPIAATGDESSQQQSTLPAGSTPSSMDDDLSSWLEDFRSRQRQRYQRPAPPSAIPPSGPQHATAGEASLPNRPSTTIEIAAGSAPSSSPVSVPSKPALSPPSRNNKRRPGFSRISNVKKRPGKLRYAGERAI